MNKWALVAALFLISAVSCRDDEWQLHVAKPPLDDGLHYCCFYINETQAIDVTALVLVDNNRRKAGEFALSNSGTANGKLSFPFYLGDEFFEHSYVECGEFDDLLFGGGVRASPEKHGIQIDLTTEASRQRSRHLESPASSTTKDTPWGVFVVHPSMNDDSLYLCSLRMPHSFTVDNIGIVLENRAGRVVGDAGLSGLLDTLSNEYVYHFWLSKELVKYSFVTFRVTQRDSEYFGRTFTVYPGNKKTVRRENGTMVLEPIK